MLSSDVREHLERYWQFSREFFSRGDFALASFLSITLIEEVGKVVILGNQELGKQLDKKGFYNHRQKYIYAVYMTLLVNSRVSRVYGDEENQFAKWFRDNELFNIRNWSLYLDLDKSTIIVPHKVTKRDDAFLLVCLAGEIYGEIQGSFTDTNVDEWQRILDEIDLFRKEHSSVP